MCVRNKHATSLTSGAILLLILCLFAVAFHFVAEGQAEANTAGMDRIAQAGQAHSHGEDHFTFFFSPELSVENAFLLGAPPLSIPAFSFSFSPQLPPPNS